MALLGTFLAGLFKPSQKSVQHWWQPIFDRMKQVLISQDIIIADETTLQDLQEDGKKAESQSNKLL